ncbi:MAG: hypothetical protein JWQ51_2209 [Tardiphaga sp.]|nr:hypothetical protein [Tardiphaga sp.]
MLKFDRLRNAKPEAYPDQAVYAEFAADACGLTFAALDDDGLVFNIASATRRIWFGGGRCSYYPQNNATATTLAADKYLSAEILKRVGIPALDGQYFFLGERHRARRPAGHERDDVRGYFQTLGDAAFVKPLHGSRGDFAQAIHGEAALLGYLDAVSRHYDAIIMQPIVEGDEYRIVVLDERVLYSARKSPPFITGDGSSTLRDLLVTRDAVLVARGVSSATSADSLDAILPAGARWTVPGRMNRSAGGDMVFESPPPGAHDMAIAAVRALGLRVGGVDLFTGLDGEPSTRVSGIAEGRRAIKHPQSMRVIEINANPSIRFLEEQSRHDLILAIWRHTFVAMGLLGDANV